MIKIDKSLEMSNENGASAGQHQIQNIVDAALTCHKPKVTPEMTVVK